MPVEEKDLGLEAAAEIGDADAAKPDNEEQLPDGEPAKVDGDVDAGGDGGGEPEVDPAEVARREAQSEKDRLYHLQAKIDFLESKLANMGTKPNEPAHQPEQSKSAIELQDYAAALMRKVDSGDMSKSDAEERFAEKKRSLAERDELMDMMAQTNARLDIQFGVGNIGELQRQLRVEGVPAGSPLEKRAYQMLKDDWGLDTKDPKTFAQIDPAKAHTIATYVVAAAAKSVDKRKPAPGAKPPAVKPPQIRQSGQPTAPALPTKKSFNAHFDELRAKGL